MRKAVWGALLLGVFAFTFGSPIRENRPLHGIVSLAGLAGYILLSMDPPVAGRRQYRFLIAGAIAGLAAFLLAVTGVPFPGNLLARVLAVATVALPLWLVAGPGQFVFVAAGALALFTGIPGVAAAGRYATSVHSYTTALGAFWVGWMLHTPSAATPWKLEKRPPRVVVASNIVTFSQAEKDARLAALDAKFKAGEIAEHKYWDKRQEIESR